MEINGANVLLYVGGVVVGSQTNVNFQRSSTPIATSSKTTVGGETYIPSKRYNSTLTLDAMYVPGAAEMASLKSAIENGTAVTVARYEGSNPTLLESATGYVTGFNEQAPDNQAATVSVNIQISGNWS